MAPLTAAPMLSAAGALVAAALLKVAVVLAAAWGVAWLLRRRSAAQRHAVWGLAVTIVVLLPVLSAGLPAWRVEVSALTPASPAEQEAYLPAPLPTRAAPGDVPPGAVEGVDLPAAVEAAARDAGASASSPAASRLFTPGVLVLLWGVGALLLLGRVLLHLIRIGRLTRQAAAGPISGAAGLSAELAALLGIRRDVRLLVTERVDLPVTWGLYRPVILLPEDAGAWPRPRLRAVLLHELAHVRRWDYLFHLLAEVACALYWPNPLVWIARHRVHVEQEQACDDRVLEAGTSSVEYAEHLLEIARSLQGRRWTLGAAVGGTIGFARRVGLKDRVRVILDHRVERRPPGRRARVLVAVGFSALALPIAALHPGGAPERPAAPASSGTEGQSAAQPPAATGEVPQEEPRFLWIEAESGMLQEPMEVVGDVEASGARAVMVPDGAGNDAPEGGPGGAAFVFEVDRPGTYVVWGRVIGDGGNDNSFYVRVDDGPEQRWDILDDEGRAEVDAWSWRLVADHGDEPVVSRYELAAGRHVLRVRNREDGTQLDRLLVTDDLSFRPRGRGPAPAGLRPDYLWIEAEHAQVDGPMRVDEDARASGRRFAWLPPDGERGRGTVEVRFDAAQAGRYVVWGRVLGADEGANSFFVSMDDGPEVVWDAPGPDPDDTTDRWAWDPVSAREGRRALDPILYDLAAGPHRLRIRAREAGTRLDGVFITNDLSYRPRGARAASPPAEPVYVWFEAEEAAALGAPWELRTEGAASGAGYVAAPASLQSLDAPPADGRAVYLFEVPQDGLYKVWGRLIARSGSQDSFWVRVDGGEWVKWNSVRRSRRWRWDEVHDDDYGEELVHFELAAGPHRLEIAYREGGASLDRLLVTNDPGFDPARPAGDGPGRPDVRVASRSR